LQYTNNYSAAHHTVIHKFIQNLTKSN
jgi:hypothetical protein